MPRRCRYSCRSVQLHVRLADLLARVAYQSLLQSRGACSGRKRPRSTAGLQGAQHACMHACVRASCSQVHDGPCMHAPCTHLHARTMHAPCTWMHMHGACMDAHAWCTLHMHTTPRSKVGADALTPHRPEPDLCREACRESAACSYAYFGMWNGECVLFEYKYEYTMPRGTCPRQSIWTGKGDWQGGVTWQKVVPQPPSSPPLPPSPPPMWPPFSPLVTIEEDTWPTQFFGEFSCHG